MRQERFDFHRSHFTRVAKNERSNIDKDEEIGLKKLASTLLTMPLSALGKALKADELIEVKCDA